MTDLPSYPGGGNPEPNPGGQGGARPPWAQGPYPGGDEPFPSFTDGPPPRPPVPQTVLNAVTLMYVGAGLSLVGLILALSTTSNIRHAYRKALPHASAHTITQDVHAVQVAIVVEAIIEIGLWLWMAWKNRAGANWARILSTVFFGISTLSILVSISQPTAVLNKLLTLLSWLVGLAIIVLLWRKESSAYFRPAKAW